MFERSLDVPLRKEQLTRRLVELWAVELCQGLADFHKRSRDVDKELLNPSQPLRLGRDAGQPALVERDESDGGHGLDQRLVGDLGRSDACLRHAERCDLNAGRYPLWQVFGLAFLPFRQRHSADRAVARGIPNNAGVHRAVILDVGCCRDMFAHGAGPLVVIVPERVPVGEYEPRGRHQGDEPQPQLDHLDDHAELPPPREGLFRTQNRIWGDVFKNFRITMVL